MTEKAQSRLYALTALACVIWLVQSTIEAVGDGTMWSIWNLFFTLALLIVIGWTGFNAVVLMRKTDKAEEEDDEDDEDTDESEDSKDSVDSAPAAIPTSVDVKTKDANRTNDISRS